MFLSGMAFGKIRGIRVNKDFHRESIAKLSSVAVKSYYYYSKS